MISNSVTHLRSYTNSAIADIAKNSAPISPVTPRDRRRVRIERRYRRIKWPPRDRRAKRRRIRIERRYRRIEWRVFDDVSQCFQSVSCFTSGSWCITIMTLCFTCVSWCFTMFNNVSCLASRATIGVIASATARPPNASGIATTPQGSAITPQKLAMMPQGSSISQRTWSHAKLSPEWRLE